MIKFLTVFIVLFAHLCFSQVPDPAFNPMTPNEAKGISRTQHILYWQNPSNAVYNEVYFSDDSNKVANLDSSVKVKNGYPSTLFNSYSVSEFGYLVGNKYFWRVVEFNSNGSTASPLWQFYPFALLDYNYQYTFNTGFEGWQIIGPQGIGNWYWLNGSHTGSTPGEIVFRWDPVFVGNSYIISPEINAQEGGIAEIRFKYFEDWWSDTVVVGCAYTTNSGTNWSSIWELHATGNVGPEEVVINIEVHDKFKLGFYYKGNSNNIDFFYVDNVSVAAVIPLTPPLPPGILTTIASENEQKVTLNWTPGWAVSGMVGYQIQKKSGLPSSNNQYVTIAETDLNTFTFEDPNVQLNQSYSYRVRLKAMGINSIYGNEATAYVPAIVPVELISFYSTSNDNNVTLNWTTATETNNYGFEIQRLQDSKIKELNEWESIGFVNGNGFSTEPKTYTFKDENLSIGKYQYRLKQIDFDGTLKYSNIIKAEILSTTNFSLEQNYPNPFNPSTSIQYSLLSKQFVQLKVYDVLGKEVATLVDEEVPAGNHKTDFNASNLSSGIYYYKLTAGEFVQTRKMVLLK